MKPRPKFQRRLAHKQRKAKARAAFKVTYRSWTDGLMTQKRLRDYYFK